MGLILITGGTGFLGRAVLEKFSDQRVIAPNRLMLDLLDQQAVNNYFDEKEITGVIHCAASCGGISLNKKQPATLAYENAVMGLNLLEAAKNKGVEKFINIGTICSYGENCPTPFKEEYLGSELPEPTNRQYGLVKFILGELGKAYKEEFGLNFVQIMPVNMLGAFDNHGTKSHVVPAIIEKIDKALENDSKVELLGTGTSTREFVCNRDVADFIRLAWDTINQAAPINVGTGKTIKISELAEKIAVKMGYNKGFDYNGKLDGQKQRRLDISRAKSFGWEPKTTLDEMLDQEILYYRTVVKI